MMRVIFLLVLACLIPHSAVAQMPLTSPALMATAVESPGTVDILVEADTYVPSFYGGRAEPTSGNTVRLIALADDTPAGNVRFTWTVNGQVLAGSGPVVRVTAPTGNSMNVRVVMVQNGQVWAERNEVIAVSQPQVRLYELNALRGRNNLAIGDTYTLIGNEAEIVAIPYFTGRGTITGALRGTWRIDGQTIDLGTAWQQLVLERPEEAKSRYHVRLDLRNVNNLAESAITEFYLHMGL